MAKEKNPSIYNPGGETILGLNNSGIGDDGHGYFINKEAEARRLRAAAAKNNPTPTGEELDAAEAEAKKRGGKVKHKKKHVKAEGHKAKRRLDRKPPKDHIPSEGYKDGGKTKWIAGAIKHPGALHKELHVPQGEKIPAKKLEKAAHSSNPTLKKRAVLAKTLKGMH